MICKSFLETELTNWKRPLLCVFVLHSQNVLHRHPLYLIVRMLCYDDGLGAGKNLLALKTTDTEQEECSIWVYQCSSSVSTKWKVFYCAFPFPDAWHLLSVWTGAGAVHLQSVVGLLRLRSDIRQVQRLRVRVGMRAKHLQNQQQLDNQHCYWQKCCTFAFLPFWEVI